MLGHGSKLTRKKEEAIAALRVHVTLAEAARATGVSPSTLTRWLKDPEFIAAEKAARRAEHRQSMMHLRQDASAAATTIRRVMADPSVKPAIRLNAVTLVIAEVDDAIQIEDLGDYVAEAERAANAAKGEEGKLPTGTGGSTPISGHGAKFPRKMEKAIAALLTQRTIAGAARVAGVGTQTLYRWMADAEFDAAYLAAARSTFGPATRLLQQAESIAVSVAQNLHRDPTVPAATRLKAAAFVYRNAKAAEIEDVKMRVAQIEGTDPADGESELGGRSKAIGRNLHRRVQRLKARLSPAHWPEDFEYVHAVDGRAAGSSVIGIDGRHIWSRPPEGCQEGDLFPMGKRSHEWRSEEGMPSVQTRVSPRGLEVQNHLRRARVGQILECRPRAAAARHSKSSADPLCARISKLTGGERSSTAGKASGRTRAFGLLHCLQSGHHLQKRHGVRFFGAQAQYIEDQKLRGVRHCLGRGGADRLEAFLRYPHPDDPQAGVGDLGDFQPRP